MRVHDSIDMSRQDSGVAGEAHKTMDRNLHYACKRIRDNGGTQDHSQIKSSRTVPGTYNKNNNNNNNNNNTTKRNTTPHAPIGSDGARWLPTFHALEQNEMNTVCCV